MTNRLPHAEPLRDGEGPCNFVAGWNMPGYLPTMEPLFFVEFDDAKRFILNAMGEHADEYALEDNESAAEGLESLRQECNLESEPFTVEDDGVAYWVEAVE